jgi:hypothetical protein
VWQSFLIRTSWTHSAKAYRKMGDPKGSLLSITSYL